MFPNELAQVRNIVSIEARIPGNTILLRRSVILPEIIQFLHRESAFEGMHPIQEIIGAYAAVGVVEVDLFAIVELDAHVAKMDALLVPLQHRIRSDLLAGLGDGGRPGETCDERPHTTLYRITFFIQCIRDESCKDAATSPIQAGDLLVGFFAKLIEYIDQGHN